PIAMQVAFTPAEIATLVGAQRVAGAATGRITDLASLGSARAGDLSFLGNTRYRTQVPASAATAILLPLDYAGEPSPGQVSVFVGRDAQVGEDCLIMPGCVIASRCSLGRRVRLQPGVVIGSDGFGYEFVEGRHEKVPQIGTVAIGDDVEIGANSTLDRARFSR